MSKILEAVMVLMQIIFMIDQDPNQPIENCRAIIEEFFADRGAEEK